MPTKEVLQTRAGVTLTKVTLSGGGLPVAIAYTVSSKRTPEVPNFDTLPAAERHFAEEVARCAAHSA